MQLTSLKATIGIEKTIELENELRKTWAQILGGAFILIGLFLTGLTVWSRWKTLEVAEEGQITERFTRAIDQLGSDKLEIRLGGIYALERIARDSEKDHWPILEVLSAYVRENAPGSSKEGSTKNEIPKEFKSPAKSSDDFLTELAQRPNPKTDIQAILTVIGRCKSSFGGVDRGIDLIRTNLGGANLRG